MAKKQKIQLSDGIHTTKGDKIFFSINYVFMILLAVITLYPMLYVLFCSFSSPNEFALVRGIMFRPAGFSVEGYRMVLKMSTLWQGYRNTLIYVLVGTSISMVMTIMGAYILSHTDFMLKKVTMILIVFTMYFGGGMIPTYLTVVQMGLNNTMWAVMLPGAVSVYNMIVLRTSFKGIPTALLESATIDGANAWQCFWRIKFPLIAPTTVYVLLTSVIFAAERAFTAINLLTQGGPSYSTTNLSYVIYEFAFKYYNIGTASAIAVFTSIIFLVITIIMMRSMGGFGYHDQK